MVSIIVPTYNRPDGLARCLERIAAQTCRDLEVCVVNDGGEGVRDVVRMFDQRIRVRLHESETNRGHVPSRNIGLSLASGELIALCDDDDRYDDDHLESLIGAIPERDLVYSGARIRAEGAGAALVHDFSYPFDAALLRETNFVIPSSVLYRRALHDRLGTFDEAADQYWDWDWVLRVAGAGVIAHVPKVTLTYAFRLDGGNMSWDPVRDRPKLDYLCAKHGLGRLESTNFYRMAVAHDRL